MNKKKRVIGYSAICLGAMLVLVWIWQLKQGLMPYTDQWTRELVQNVADTRVYSVFRWVTELGSRTFVQPMTIIMTIVLWALFRSYRPALLFDFGVLGTHLLNKLVKELVARERPSISVLLNAEGYSFPSGHAMVSLVCYGLLGFLLSEKCRSIKMARFLQYSSGLVILVIGFSRYMINVHYLTDVFAGYLLGLIVLISLIRLYKWMDMKKRKAV